MKELFVIVQRSADGSVHLYEADEAETAAQALKYAHEWAAPAAEFGVLKITLTDEQVQAAIDAVCNPAVPAVDATATATLHGHAAGYNDGCAMCDIPDFDPDTGDV